MKILITSNELNDRIKKLGKIISNDLSDQKNIVVLPILKGGLIFAAHLIPHLQFPFKLDYFHTSRYQDNKEGNELIYIYSPRINLNGKTIILIDDIYDMGVTLDSIEKQCYNKGAKNVITIVLLDKQKTNKSPNYIGFNIQDHFVFGFGLDKEGYERNLPYIAYDEE